MPVEELTSSIDRYQSAHSAAGVPRAFAIGAPARPVPSQTYSVRPQSHGAPAQTLPAHLRVSSKPSSPRFNSDTSGAGQENASGHSFFPRKRCFERGSTIHFRHNCSQLLGKSPPKPEASVKRVSVGILRDDQAPKEQRLCANRVIMILHHCLTLLCHLIRM